MTYYFNQSDLESILLSIKNSKILKKELLKENKLANNYDLYEQYMSKIQNILFWWEHWIRQNICKNKRRVNRKTREYINDIYCLGWRIFDDEDELLEYEKALQEAYITPFYWFQGYYQIL